MRAFSLDVFRMKFTVGIGNASNYLTLINYFVNMANHT
jgi:hypothetical protein